MKDKLSRLFRAIKSNDGRSVARILDEGVPALPECYLRAAENTGDSAMVLTLATHLVNEGIDEQYESPLMQLIKLGLIEEAGNIACATIGTLHDFTDKDQYGLTVLDWAEVMGEGELLAYLEECKEKSLL